MLYHVRYCVYITIIINSRGQEMNSENIDKLRTQLKSEIKQLFIIEQLQLKHYIQQQLLNQQTSIKYPTLPTTQQPQNIKYQLNLIKEQIKQLKGIKESFEKLILSHEIQNILKKQEHQDKIQHRISVEGIINQESAHLQQFIIEQNVVEKKEGGFFSPPYQLLGSIPIAMKPVNQFTILGGDSLVLGVVDAKYIHDRDSQAHGRKQCIGYNIKPKKKGQKVVMSVEQNRITWKKGSQKLAQRSSQLLMNSSIKWVPFIVMFQKGDKIIWQ